MLRADGSDADRGDHTVSIKAIAHRRQGDDHGIEAGGNGASWLQLRTAFTEQLNMGNYLFRTVSKRGQWAPSRGVSCVRGLPSPPPHPPPPAARPAQRWGPRDAVPLIWDCATGKTSCNVPKGDRDWPSLLVQLLSQESPSSAVMLHGCLCWHGWAAMSSVRLHASSWEILSSLSLPFLLPQRND